MSSIARQYGFHDPDKLYSAPDNSALKTKRTNPNILAAGDTVKIPDKETKVEQRAADSKHKFKAKGFLTHLRLVIEDFETNPLENKAYKLEVGQDVYEDTTKGGGLIEQLVSASAKKGKLTVWLDDKKISCISWLLEIGDLDPHDEATGVQARLNNLGYTCGPVDGKVGPLTKAAVKSFKKKNGLADNDTIDAATQDKLKELYGF